MTKSCLLASCVFFAGCLASAHAQIAPKNVESTFTVNNAALAMHLWAAEPLFANPTCIDIDPMGRVWICESVNYRTTLHHRPPNRPEGDRILILEDSAGSGRADKVTTFYQSTEILAPLGIAVAKDPLGPGFKVFVCQSPDILVFEDKDGDGHADGPPRKLLSGFGGVDHDHGVHGILIGPDGKLYFSVGDQGVNGLVDRHGKTWKTNHSDCQGGTIWRCDLDGKNLELLAHNFRNEYEPCVDSFGTLFVSDNDDDGSQQTRICYVMPGGNYGYWPRGPGQSHWHEESPGVVPKILRTYFGSPTGICVYEGQLLPRQYWGQLLHTDAGPRHVRCYHLEGQGAGFGAIREDLVTSTDTWFRPSDVCVAPDGSIFVADWYDPGVGGHGMGDTTRGRIYRIAPKNSPYQVPPVNLKTRAGIISAMASPALSVRYMAISRLKQMPAEEAWRLLKPIADSKNDAALRARALWQMGFADPKRFVGLVPGLFDETDPRFRILALRILKDACELSPGDLPNVASAVTKDSSAAVRREALLLLRDAEPGKVKDLILQLASAYDGNDRFYLEAVGIAVGRDSGRRAIILDGFAKRFAEWNEATADLFWELEPPFDAERIAHLLTKPELSSRLRARIVDILAASDDPKAGKQLLAALLAPLPMEVTDQIVASMRLCLAGKWQNLTETPEFHATVDKLIGQPATQAAALLLIGAARVRSEIPRVAGIASDAMKSKAIRRAAVATLGQVPASESVAVLKSLLRGDKPEIQADAVQALGAQGTAESLGALEEIVSSPSEDLRLKAAAASTLAETRKGSLWLLEMTKNKALNPEVQAGTARLLRNSPFKDIRNRAMATFPPPGRINPDKPPNVAWLLERRGQAARGKLLMAATMKNDLQCLKCHTVRGVGGQVGPDLSVIGKKASRENLYDSILFPSKAIADQYVAWSLETKDGLALTGLIVEETVETLTLRDANGKDTRVAKKNVQSRTKSTVSLMPANLLAYMTEDDLVDIVEYLFGLRTPFLTVESWQIAGPFDDTVDEKDMEMAIAPVNDSSPISAFKGKFGQMGWQNSRVNEQGYLDLRSLFAPARGRMVAYLCRQIDSPAEQDSTLLFSTEGATKVFLNGKMVFQRGRQREHSDQENSVQVRLKKGTNRLLIKMTSGDGPFGLRFSLLAEQEVKAP
jgi:putative membrane-bound dehydrogenase-like protein